VRCGQGNLRQPGGWNAGLVGAPTDPANEGAITLQTMRGEDGRVPAVLDIVDVPFSNTWATTIIPKTDWDTARRWRRQGTFPPLQSGEPLRCPAATCGPMNARTRTKSGRASFAKNAAARDPVFIKTGGEHPGLHL